MSQFHPGVSFATSKQPKKADVRVGKKQHRLSLNQPSWLLSSSRREIHLVRGNKLQRSFISLWQLVLSATPLVESSSQLQIKHNKQQLQSNYNSSLSSLICTSTSDRVEFYDRRRVEITIEKAKSYKSKHRGKNRIPFLNLIIVSFIS